MTQSIQKAETLLALAERCEAASERDQGRLIEHAWEALAECSPSFRRFALADLSGFDNNADKFALCLEARAYESAAMMLVPEGFVWTINTFAEPVKASAYLVRHDNCYVRTREHFCATPALALSAACLLAVRQILQEGSPA